MKRTVTLLFALIVISQLVGCAWMWKTPEPVVRYQNVLITPADNLIVDCEVQPPPSLELYTRTKDWGKKEKILMDALNASVNKAVVCNVRWTNLRAWKKEQVKIHETPVAEDK